MLQTSTSFPNPGSIAVHAGQQCRVLQHLPGARALICPTGPASAQPRRVPLAELDDPAAENARVRAAFSDREEAECRRALWIAQRLRAANEIGLSELDRDMADAARRGLAPLCRDTRHLTAILRRLGWRRAGFTGAGHDRAPLYRRVGIGLDTLAPEPSA